jgi:hypothetical protein
MDGYWFGIRIIRYLQRFRKTGNDVRVIFGWTAATTLAASSRLRLPVFLWNLEYQFVKTDFSIPQAYYLHIYIPWGMEARLERRDLSTIWHLNCDWGSLQNQPELRVLTRLMCRWVGGLFVHKKPSESLFYCYIIWLPLDPQEIWKCWASTSDWFCAICCAVEKAGILSLEDKKRLEEQAPFSDLHKSWVLLVLLSSLTESCPLGSISSPAGVFSSGGQYSTSWLGLLESAWCSEVPSWFGTRESELGSSPSKTLLYSQDPTTPPDYRQRIALSMAYSSILNEARYKYLKFEKRNFTSRETGFLEILAGGFVTLRVNFVHRYPRHGPLAR